MGNPGHPHAERGGRTLGDVRVLGEVRVEPGEPGATTLSGALRAALDGGPAVAPVPVADAERIRAALAPDDPAVPLERADVVTVVPTSGSTGAPKGVLLTDGAIRIATAALADKVGGAGAWVLALPVHAVGGLMVLVRALLAGAPTYVDPSTGGATRFDPRVFAETTAAARAAYDGHLATSLVPTQLARLEEAGCVDALRAYDTVLVGAAATPAPLAARLRERGIRLYVSYGMSETCGGCAYDGIPQRGLDFRTETPDGCGVGRLSVTGAAVAAGYRCRPDDPDLRDGTIRTQDVGRIDAGRVTILGRLDDVVQVGGTNVALGAVEAALAEVDGVGQVCAIADPDDVYGARIVVHVDGEADDEVLREAVLTRLGRAAAPQRIVRWPALPMLPTGKIDRLAIRRAGRGRG